MQYTISDKFGLNLGKMSSKCRHVEMQLGKKDVFTLMGDQRLTRIKCLEGSLWVTQPGDTEDHILDPGQSFIVNHSGPVIIEGIPFARARLIPAKEKLI
jgi:hypothetical protein